MSEHRTLRDLVTERLTLAAEEIFALFERTIAEYEEELFRWREESQRKLHRLDQVSNPWSLPIPPDLCLNQGVTEIKEDPEEERIKEEEQHPSVSLPVSSAICVKSEYPPKLLQIHTEHQEDIPPESSFRTHTERHTGDDGWEPQADCSAAAHMETEADEDHNYPALIIGTNPAAVLHSTVSLQNKPGKMLDRGTNRSNHQCFICQKRFRRKMELQRHIRVHTGERPYSCSVCTKTFNQKIHLEVHMRTHNSEKPYCCPVCTKTFTQKVHLEVHLRTHTGERPYSCPECDKTFTQKVYQQKHMISHTEGTQ